MGKTALEELVTKRRAEGVSQSEIAREAKLSRQRIAQICKLLGIASKHRGPRREVRLRRLPALMREGLSLSKIAERLNVSTVTVTSDMSVLPDYPMLEAARLFAKPAAARRAAIPKLIQLGLCRRQIAKKLGWSSQVVSRDIQLLKLPHSYHDKLKANRVAADPRTGPVALRRARVRELSRKGQDALSIAQELGISKITVNNDLVRMRARK